jgi:hypothetical protein
MIDCISVSAQAVAAERNYEPPGYRKWALMSIPVCSSGLKIFLAGSIALMEQIWDIAWKWFQNPILSAPGRFEMQESKSRRHQF